MGSGPGNRGKPMISLRTSFVALPTLVCLTALSNVAHAQPVMPPTHSSVVAESSTCFSSFMVFLTRV